MSDTVYIIGESRTNLDNAITIIYNSFYMGIEIDIQSNKVVDIGCVHTLSLTEKIVKDIFIGKDINDSELIEKEVKRRYHGTSQRAIIVSYKDALKKYLEVKNKFYM